MEDVNSMRVEFGFSLASPGHFYVGFSVLSASLIFFFFPLELPFYDPQEETVSHLLLYRRSQICRSPGPMSPQRIDLAHTFDHEGRQQSSASQRPREATLLRAIACDFHMGRRGQEGRRPLALPAVLLPDKLCPWPSRAS